MACDGEVVRTCSIRPTMTWPRSAVLLLAASCAVLCAVLLAAWAWPSHSRPAAVYDVGDETGWAVPPGSDPGALNEWAARHRFLVGDVLGM